MEAPKPFCRGLKTYIEKNSDNSGWFSESFEAGLGESRACGCEYCRIPLQGVEEVNEFEQNNKRHLGAGIKSLSVNFARSTEKKDQDGSVSGELTGSGLVLRSRDSISKEVFVVDRKSDAARSKSELTFLEALTIL